MADAEIRRCYYCNRVCKMVEVRVEGNCPACGSRKFRAVVKMTDEEMDDLVATGFNTDEWKHYESTVG